MAIHLLLQVRVGFDHSQEKDFYLFSSGQTAPLHFKHRLVVSPFCSLDPSGFPPHIHVSLPQTIDMLVRLFTDWRFAIGVNVCVCVLCGTQSRLDSCFLQIIAAFFLQRNILM